MTMDNGNPGEGSRSQRGLLLGREINLKPEPPAKDLLDGPLVVTKLPAIKLVRETFKDRVTALLVRTMLGYREGEYKTMVELRRTTAAVIASVSRAAERRLEDAGWILEGRGIGAQRVVQLTHPDQLRDAFQAMMLAPEALSHDSRALEVLLAVVLRNYLREISRVTSTRFSFETEAHSHCMTGYEQERQLKNVIDSRERVAVIQNIYNSYMYTVNYYQYSLITRERAEHGGKMFSMYIRAIFFNSRVM